MKIAPVSADLLIKLTLIAAAVAGVWYVGSKATAAVSGAASAIWDPISNAVVDAQKAVEETAAAVWKPVEAVIYPNPKNLGNTIEKPMHNTYDDPNGFAIY